MSDSTKRFSTRVPFYVRSRPGYPASLIEFFRSNLSLKPDHTIADIGSGTGILSQLFLHNGNTVYCIEPNAEMRAAGDSQLAQYPNYRPIHGTAEATTLADSSVDFVTAGQAFHWFDPVNKFEIREFENHQDLNWQGLLDRVYSSSYMPLPDDPINATMTPSLRQLFDQFANNGSIRIEYRTRLYCGGFRRG
jgi:SAM-dependent methyltransferase